MRLTQVRVQNYRSVRDTGWFDVEQDKTILVGPSEAGKTAVLEALQRINPPDAVKGFDVLRDYPRKLYNADIQSGRLDPKNIPVASAWFELEPGDLAELPDGFGATGYRCTRYLDSGHLREFEDEKRWVGGEAPGLAGAAGRGQGEARRAGEYPLREHGDSRRYSVDYRRLNNLLDSDVRAEIVAESESEYLRVS